jgi:hypothetical protein
MATAQTSTNILFDPRSTYLANVECCAVDSPAINLAALGFSPGDPLLLQANGAYSPGGALPPESVSGCWAVFSSSLTLLPASERYRVPGAIGIGLTVDTGTACFTTPIERDIPSDFFVPTNGVVVTVPANAAVLFVSANDCYFSDNADPDHDYGIGITGLSSSRPLLSIASTQGTNSGVALSWSAIYTGYALQQNPALDTINWAANTNSVNLVNGTNHVTITPAPGNMLYRLVHP